MLLLAGLVMGMQEPGLKLRARQDEVQQTAAASKPE